MALHTWLIYLVAAIGLSLTPGPNSRLALTHGALHGHRRTLFTIFGGALGFVAVIALSMFGIGALPDGKRKERLTEALDGVMELFADRVLPFDVDAARRYADLAVKARAAGKGFPTPDGYIAAIAAAKGFAVATRDNSAFEAANVTVIDPWKAGR